MNLIQQAEALKNIPDQALAQMQQRPTDMPPYLVVAEMTRRTNMRKAYQASQNGSPMNQPTVVQQMGQQFAQQGQPQGQMPMGPSPQGMPPGMAPQQGPPPMQMAGGGIADLAQYFQQMQGPQEMLPQVDPYMLDLGPYPGPPKDPRWDEMRKFKVNPKQPLDWKTHLAMMTEQMGESPLTAEVAKFEAQEKELRGKKPNINQILIQLGLGMAASRRPDFAGVVGEGGMQALHGFTQERDRNTALADRAGARRLQAMEGSQRHKDRLQDYAIEAARSDRSSYNTDRMSDTNIELSIMRQQKEEELAERLAARQITAQEAQFELAEFNKGADADRRMAEIERQVSGNKEVARIRNERPRGSGNAIAPAQREREKQFEQLKDLAAQWNSQANGLERAAATTVIPNEKASLSQQAAAARRQAATYRQRMEALLNGGNAAATPPKSFGMADLLKFFDSAGGPASGRQAPIVIPPPR